LGLIGLRCRELLLQAQGDQAHHHARLKIDQSFNAMIYLAAAVINSH
jgi:hypothetical protein